MPIYDIELFHRGKKRSVGAKIVTAPSAQYIRNNPNRFVGPNVRIGKIIKFAEKTERAALQKVRKDEGWTVRNGVRVSTKKRSKQRSGIGPSISDLSSFAKFKFSPL